jgi:hypothetical protein
MHRWLLKQYLKQFLVLSFFIYTFFVILSSDGKRLQVTTLRTPSPLQTMSTAGEVDGVSVGFSEYAPSTMSVRSKAKASTPRGSSAGVSRDRCFLCLEKTVCSKQYKGCQFDNNCWNAVRNKHRELRKGDAQEVARDNVKMVTDPQPWRDETVPFGDADLRQSAREQVKAKFVNITSCVQMNAKTTVGAVVGLTKVRYVAFMLQYEQKDVDEANDEFEELLIAQRAAGKTTTNKKGDDLVWVEENPREEERDGTEVRCGAQLIETNDVEDAHEFIDKKMRLMNGEAHPPAPSTRGTVVGSCRMGDSSNSQLVQQFSRRARPFGDDVDDDMDARSQCSAVTTASKPRIHSHCGTLFVEHDHEIQTCVIMCVCRFRAVRVVHTYVQCVLWFLCIHRPRTLPTVMIGLLSMSLFKHLWVC